MQEARVSLEIAERRFHENYRLAPYFARRWFASFPRHCHEDVLSEAWLGLWKACTTYDETRGTAFTTYAGSVITKQIGMFYRDYIQRSRGAEVLSFEHPVVPIGHDSKRNLTVEDTLTDDTDLEELVVCNELKEHLKQLDPIAYDYYVNDKKQRTLSKEYDLCQALISRRIRRAVAKLKNRYAACG